MVAGFVVVLRDANLLAKEQHAGIRPADGGRKEETTVEQTSLTFLCDNDDKRRNRRCARMPMDSRSDLRTSTTLSDAYSQQIIMICNGATGLSFTAFAHPTNQRLRHSPQGRRQNHFDSRNSKFNDARVWENTGNNTVRLYGRPNQTVFLLLRVDVMTKKGFWTFTRRISSCTKEVQIRTTIVSARWQSVNGYH